MSNGDENWFDQWKQQRQAPPVPPGQMAPGQPMPPPSPVRTQPPPGAGDEWFREWQQGRQPAAPKVEKPDAPEIPDTWVGRLAGVFTGKGRTEFPDVPEMHVGNLYYTDDKGRERLIPSVGGRLKVYMGQLFARDPRAMADVVKSAFPEAEVSADRFGNPMISYKGQRYYVNKPGVSSTDLLKASGDILTVAPATGPISKVPTMVGRGLATGAAAGAGSIAQDVATGALGGKSEHGLTVPEVLGEAGVAAGIGGVLSPVAEAVPMVYRAVRGQRAPNLTQEMIDKGRTAAKGAGLDPDAYTPTQLAELGRVPGATPDKVRVRASELRSEATGIPLTRGQRTGQDALLAEERRLRSGPAADVMEDFYFGQNKAVQDALRAAAPRRAEGEIGTDIQSIVRQKSQEAKGEIKGAYQQIGTTAKERAGKLLFHPQGTGQLPTAVRERLTAGDVVIDELTPAARGMIKIIDDATTEFSPALGRNVPKVFNVEDMERTRRQLLRRYPSGAFASKEDQRAAGAIQRHYDDLVGDMLDRKLYFGDEQAVEQLRKARALRADYAQKFQPQKIDGTVGRQVQKMIDEDMSGQHVLNWVYGAGKITGAGNSEQIVNRLAKIGGGEQSPMMSSLRDAARQRVIYGATMPEGGEISPLAAAKNIRNAFSGKGDEVTNRLLGDRKQEFLQLADQLEAAGRGGVSKINPSGTGQVVNELLRTGGAAGAGAFVGRMVEPTYGPQVGAALGVGARRLGQNVAANRAVAQTKLSDLVKPSVIGAAGGEQLPSYYDQLFGP